MDIYVYSDESGVFDKVHNDIFVFGGLIILDKQSKETWSHLYSAAENTIRNIIKDRSCELKAANLSNSNKDKLFRSLNKCIKFGVVIDQSKILDRIFITKKDKQRYLDYAYKIAVKRAFEELIKQHTINPNNINNIFFYIDEHTTATNGCYELKEGLEQEFKIGTYNYGYYKYYPPIFPKLKSIELNFYDSKSKLLIRAADIVANKIFYITRNNIPYDFKSNNLYLTKLP